MTTNRFLITIGLLACLLAIPATLNASDTEGQESKSLSTTSTAEVILYLTDECGDPLAGASVYMVKGTRIIAGTTTDCDGHAHVMVSLPAKLRICFVGCKDVEIELTPGVNILNITMKYSNI